MPSCICFIIEHIIDSSTIFGKSLYFFHPLLLVCLSLTIQSNFSNPVIALVQLVGCAAACIIVSLGVNANDTSIRSKAIHLSYYLQAVVLKSLTPISLCPGQLDGSGTCTYNIPQTIDVNGRCGLPSCRRFPPPTQGGGSGSRC